MGVEKMSVSFDLALGHAIRESASAEHQSVSAWLTDAARARLRLGAVADAVSAWEAEFGTLTDDEVARADRLLEDASEHRDHSAA